MRSTKSCEVAARAFGVSTFGQILIKQRGDTFLEVGGKSVSHGRANATPFEEAVSHLRDAAVARLSLLRDRPS